ncbi:MAG: type IV pilin protein [Pseudohongiellaceae bacterium]|nr:type IV pilin protein [Pseudohongiellaceae bacterium]
MKLYPKLQLSNGFTLIELMISVAIVGVLALVAYPAYQDSVQRSRRADGIAAALGIQVAQESFRSNCRFYAQNLGANNVCGANAGASTVQASATSAEGFYALSIQAASATGNAYTIVIDPQGQQAGDSDCDPMTLTFNNANPTGLKAPTACW